MYLLKFSEQKSQRHEGFKPCIRDDDPEHIILPIRSNELIPENSSEQQNLLTVDLENDLISEKKRVTISGTTPKNDEWNNKSHNINSQIIDMCKKPNIDFIANSIFNPKKHLNISKQHLNKQCSLKVSHILLNYISSL